MSLKIYVGMSGGVDSSLTAALLKESGYDVVGVYMKNWTKDLPGFNCPWQEDFNDAKRVAVQLDIPFKVYDLEKDYRQKVVDYLLEGYKSGLTPNPDIMCNQEIKFKLFLDLAMAEGADKIATGHYARIINKTNNYRLKTGIDLNKDQSYFLYRMSNVALEKSLMPIGEYLKPNVRKLATERKLFTANKKDSQGICFVGKVGIKDFLTAELGVQPIGQIIDDKNQVIGEHDGALYYTIGQRHGLNIGGGLPYYVTGKDMIKNVVYVTRNIQDPMLWSKNINLTNMHWLNKSIKTLSSKDRVMARVRYRAPFVSVESLKQISDDKWQLELSEEVKAIAVGQSVVFYQDDYVLGGGIII